MAEHRIRLRGGWECLYRQGDEEGSPEVSRRIDLPAESISDWPAQIRLTRQFGRPPVDLQIEEVFLELKNVPGLRRARLNGLEIDLSSCGNDACTLAFGDPLLPRNGLLLEVQIDSAIASTTGWGEIALVIRPRSDEAGSAR